MPASSSHSRITATRYGRIRLILAFTLLGAAVAAAGQTPPSAPWIARQAAQREAATQEARGHYLYRQKIELVEIAPRGGPAGVYREVRQVVFTPEGKRFEQLLSPPVLTLKRLLLTEEDFHDFREVQPFVFTPDVVWLYGARLLGEEPLDGEPCWLLQLTPRQLLEGMRLFEGRFWISRRDYSILRLEGKAVPQIRSTKTENLFPYFTTFRRLVDGYWFPHLTVADDTLDFRSGPQRVRLRIEYTDYRKFVAESTITYQPDPVP